MVSFVNRVNRRVRQSHENHRRIAAGAFWVALFVLAAKVFVAAREVAIAWRFGTSSVVDAYQIAITVSTWVPIILTSSIGSVIVPRLVALHRDPPAYRNAIARFNGLILTVGAVVTAAALLAARPTVDLLGTGLPDDARQTATAMSRLLAPTAMFIIASAWLAARLQARERYAYSFVEAAPAVAITAFVLAAPAGGEVASLTLGTLLGYLAQTLWLLHMTRQADAPLGRVKFSWTHDPHTSILAPMAWMLAGQITLAFANPLDQAFAGSIGAGAIAALGYASRVVGLVTGLGAVVAARALLPVLAGVAADGNIELGRSQALKWTAVLFGVGAFAMAAAWLLAPLVITLLYERGAFTARDTEIVTEAFRYGTIQLPFFFGGIAIVQWIVTLRRYDILLWGAIGGIVSKIAVNWLTVVPLGVSGLMLSTSTMYAASFVIQCLFLRVSDEKYS